MHVQQSRHLATDRKLRAPARSRVAATALFDDYGRRIVVPLVKASAVGRIANPRFNPSFKIANKSVVLHPLELVSVALEKLGKPVASLAADGDRIILALEDLLARAWG